MHPLENNKTTRYKISRTNGNFVIIGIPFIREYTLFSFNQYSQTLPYIKHKNIWAQNSEKYTLLSLNQDKKIGPILARKFSQQSSRDYIL